MPNKITDLDIGPAKVEWNEKDLGLTFGNVTVRFGMTTAELRADQLGTQAVDEVITGATCEVEMSLAEHNFLTYAVATKGTTQTEGGNEITGDESPWLVKATTQVGRRLRSYAKQLKLTLYKEGSPSSDVQDVVIFPLAYPLRNWEVVYETETQRVIRVTFRCFQDDTGVLAYIGKQSEETNVA